MMFNSFDVFERKTKSGIFLIVVGKWETWLKHTQKYIWRGFRLLMTMGQDNKVGLFSSAGQNLFCLISEKRTKFADNMHSDKVDKNYIFFFLIIPDYFLF